MKIIADAICRIGGRDYNQDSHNRYIGDNLTVLSVCDGLGSYYGSEVASAVTADTLAELGADADSDGAVFNPSVINNYVRTAHACIQERKEKDSRLRSSCTTLSAVFTDYKTVYGAHIGDSRVYYFKNNKLAYQSVDHSMAQAAVERGEITTREIRIHPDQNKLTRVLGGDYYTAPDVLELGALEQGDKFILCTDGFWEYVYEEEMEAVLACRDKPKDVIKELEKLLLSRVQKYNDNYTVMVACVVEGGRSENKK